MQDVPIAEDRFCENPHCLVGRWSVTRQAEPHETWHIVAYFEETVFVVAAATPVCPCCGKPLLSHLEIDGGLVSNADEEGPLFDFIRTL
ncbi:MAG: hypothetical protein KF832_19725 [Caldilineaceae bacterium]|nr:hypothetical protein [Caldilineaceae bacterium]